MQRRVALGLLAAGVALVAAAGGWYVWLRPHDRLALARSLMAHGDAASAQLELRGVLQDDPGDAEAHFRLAEVHLRLGDPVAAERELATAARLGWDAHAIAPTLAETLLAQGRFADVLRRTGASAGLAPDQAARLLIARSGAELGLQRSADARADAARAEALAPQDPAAALAVAEAARAGGDRGAAIAATDRALAENPRDVPALLLRATLRREAGDTAGALAALDAAVAAAPEVPGPHLARALLLLALRQSARARPDVNALLAVAPHDPVASYLDAWLLAHAGDFHGAEAALGWAEPALDRLPRGRMLLAVVKARLGEPEQAANAAAQAFDRTPGDPAAARLAATLALAAHRANDAAEITARAAAAGFDTSAFATPAPDLVALLDQAPTAPAGAASVLAALRAGRPDQAAAALAALPPDPNNPALRDRLTGMVRLAHLDFPGAQAAIEATLARNPGDEQARISLAGLQALQGQAAAAEASLRAVLATDPANVAALTALQRLLEPGRADDMLAALTRAHVAAPAEPRVTAALVGALIQARQPQQALAALEAAPAPPTPDGAALLLQARAQAQDAAGQKAAAEATLRQLLTIRPADTATRLALIGLLRDGQDWAGAAKVADEGLAAEPGAPALLAAAVAAVVRAGGLPAGLDRADALARDPANLPAALTLRGGAYLTAGRPADAAQAFEAALAAHKDSADLALAAAEALTRAGQAARGDTLLQDWLALHPDNAPVAFAVALHALAAGRTGAARAGLLDLLARQPDNAAVLNDLALVEQRMGDMAAAREHAQRAWLLSATAQAADTLGWILLGGDAAAPGGAPAPSAAIDLLRQAATSLPGDPSVQYHYAVALKDAGQRAAATAILARLVPPAAAFAEQDQARRLLQELAPS